MAHLRYQLITLVTLLVPLMDQLLWLVYRWKVSKCVTFDSNSTSEWLRCAKKYDINSGYKRNTWYFYGNIWAKTRCAKNTWCKWSLSNKKKFNGCFSLFQTKLLDAVESAQSHQAGIRAQDQTQMEALLNAMDAITDAINGTQDVVQDVALLAQSAKAPNLISSSIIQVGV